MSRIIKKATIATNEWTAQINNTNIKVGYGDIFSEKPYKVISFNEYFDTVVDDYLISHISLNGQFIDNHVTNIEYLDEEIARQIDKYNFNVAIDEQRQNGKKIRCRMGSIVKFDDFLLVAFSRFNKRDEAILTRQEHYECLQNFWNEVGRVYAHRQISLPLLGARTRTELSEQELLESLIKTFELSKVRLAGEGINIILHDTIKTKVNLSLL